MTIKIGSIVGVYCGGIVGGGWSQL